MSCEYEEQECVTSARWGDLPTLFMNDRCGRGRKCYRRALPIQWLYRFLWIKAPAIKASTHLTLSWCLLCVPLRFENSLLNRAISLSPHCSESFTSSTNFALVDARKKYTLTVNRESRAYKSYDFIVGSLRSARSRAGFFTLVRDVSVWFHGLMDNAQARS
jgi:hypothetical protein